MRNIYAGATFVIAAGAAMDASKRFLVDQVPHAMSACLLDAHVDYSSVRAGRTPSLAVRLSLSPARSLQPRPSTSCLSLGWNPEDGYTKRKNWLRGYSTSVIVN